MFFICKICPQATDAALPRQMDGRPFGFLSLQPQFIGVPVSLPEAAHRSDTPSEKTDIYESVYFISSWVLPGFLLNTCVFNSYQPNGLEETQQSSWLCLHDLRVKKEKGEVHCDQGKRKDLKNLIVKP